MKIVRERPSQRLHHRVLAPVFVDIDGVVCPAADWSLGGLRIEGFPGDLPAHGDCVECALSLPFQGFTVSFEAQIEIIRVDAEAKGFAASFDTIGDREQGLMAHFIDELVRGSMVPLEDTIQRIDVPVTPVPTTPDPNPVDQMPLRRWPIKSIVISAIYVFLGIFVFGYLALSAYFAVFRLEVETAVVVSERRAMTSPATGRVAELLVQQGALVEKGTLLALLSDRNLEERKSVAESQLRVAIASHEETLSLLAEEAKRAEGYQLISDNNIAQVTVQIEMLAAQEDTLLKGLTRLRQVATEGAGSSVAEAELALGEVASELKRKRIHLKELERLNSLGGGRRLYDGAAFVGELAALEAAAVRTEAEVDSARVLVSDITEQEAGLAIIAPWRARIVSFQRESDDEVNVGDDVLVIERTGHSEVAAYLSQAEISRVREGDTARIYFPSRDSWSDATISGVDRTDGFFDAIKMNYRARSLEARSAKIMLDVIGDVPRSGVPAIVIFQRRPSNPILGLIDNWMHSS